MPSSTEGRTPGPSHLDFSTHPIEVVTEDEEISVVDVATRIDEGINPRTDRSPNMRYRVVSLGSSWRQGLEGGSSTTQRRMKASGNSLRKS